MLVIWLTILAPVVVILFALTFLGPMPNKVCWPTATGTECSDGSKTLDKPPVRPLGR